MYIISRSLIHHSGHSLMHNDLGMIPQIKSQYMQEYHAIKIRETPEGLGKGVKFRKLNSGFCCANPHLGISNTLFQLWENDHVTCLKVLKD